MTYKQPLQATMKVIELYEKLGRVVALKKYNGRKVRLSKKWLRILAIPDRDAEIEESVSRIDKYIAKVNAGDKGIPNEIQD